jgi:putative ABC transport system substrate-binding protein
LSHSWWSWGQIIEVSVSAHLLLRDHRALNAIFRSAAEYVDKIRRGAKLAELPIELPTRFKLVVDLKMAKALDLTLSPLILAQADEVVE